MERSGTKRATPLCALVAALSLFGCSSAASHSVHDYAGAVALGDPDGSLTTIVGPATAVVRMDSAVKFPQGDTASVRSVLMYDHPDTLPGVCLFQIGHVERHSVSIVKEEIVKQPCDGKRWARFRIAGSDVGFVAHLMRTSYKGTPVTLLEIGDHQAPQSLRVVY